jgi:hypothetical protein
MERGGKEGKKESREREQGREEGRLTLAEGFGLAWMRAGRKG